MSDRLTILATLDLGPWTCCWLFGGGMILVVLASIAGPVLRYHARLRRQQRVRSGLCPTCGYDLRASKGRCPECGAPKQVPPG